jgi:hypothetical protein
MIKFQSAHSSGTSTCEIRAYFDAAEAAEVSDACRGTIGPPTLRRRFRGPADATRLARAGIRAARKFAARGADTLTHRRATLVAGDGER